MNYNIFIAIVLALLSPVIMKFYNDIFKAITNISAQPTPDQWREIGKYILFDRENIPATKEFVNERFVSLKSVDYLSNFDEDVIRVWELRNGDISQIPHIKKAFDYGNNSDRIFAFLKWCPERRLVIKTDVKKSIGVNFIKLIILLSFILYIINNLSNHDTSKMNLFTLYLHAFDTIAYLALFIFCILVIVISFFRIYEAKKSSKIILTWT